MPIKVETYQSEDGKFHATELEAIRHEALNALGLAVPEIRDRWPLVTANIDKIAGALQHLAAHLAENHPEPSAQTTLEPDEDRGGCDCSASLAGNGGPHHPTCPMFRPTVIKASDKPKLDVCSGS